ncbi:MAG: primase [Schlesneria sp.]|nr:primase [Schlesneria sp.]
MNASLPLRFIELVRSRTDLVQLTSESVTLELERTNQVLKGLCPFHDDDRSASFSVNPSRQSYKCWVCGEGGDCFSYLMKRDHLSFTAALEILARRAGLELPD